MASTNVVAALREFLGLIGYYRRFLRNFGIIYHPPSRNSYKTRSSNGHRSKEGIRHTSRSYDVPTTLALPNFNDKFIIETDASSIGMGDVLVHNGHPLAFTSKALGNRKRSLSTYEHELMAIIFAMK